MNARETAGARKAALTAGEKYYFTGLLCKSGHNSPRQTSNGRCVTCIKEYAAKNAEKLRDSVRRCEQKNPEKKAARIRAWAKNNPHKKNSKEARRRAAVMSRTPGWLTEDDKWMIEQAYELAALRTQLFNFSWHVDHIVPLQGRSVSGLHTPTNLQVIPAAENLRKQNRHEVN